MTTGQRPFSGDTAISTLIAVLTTEPKSARRLNRSIPRELDNFILRCLEKAPEDRFPDARQALAALQRVRDLATRRMQQRLFYVAALFLLAAFLGAYWWQKGLSRQGTPNLILRRLTAGDVASSVSLSPDGKRVVYSSDRSGKLDLWLQDLSGTEPIRLTSDPGAETDPVFSPDGGSVAFHSDQDGGGVYLISTDGRNRRLIGPGGRDPIFSPDGKWIAYWQGMPTEGDAPRAGAAKSFVVPATGGTPRQIASDLSSASHPLFSPDGKHLLVLGFKEGNTAYVVRRGSDIYSLVDLATGKSTELTIAKQFPAYGLRFPSIQVWTKKGILFSGGHGDEMNIWYAPVSADLTLTGTPQALTSGLSETTSHLSVGGGKLAFYSGEGHNAIWLLPIEPNSGKPLGTVKRAVSRPGIMAHPNLSPDGNYLMYTVFSSGSPDLILRDLKTGNERLVARREKPELVGHFLADNSTVLFEEGATGGGAEVIQWDLRSGTRHELFEHGSAQGPSASGRWISYWARQDNGSNSIWAAERGTGASAQIISDNHSQMYVPNFSPDEHWIAFLARNGPERSRIFIAPFRGLTRIPQSEWIPLSPERAMDDKPEWSLNGALLYYLSDRDGYRCIWAQRLSAVTKRPKGQPFAVQHFHEIRSCMLGVNLGYQALSVSRDKLAFMLSEQSGGIWVADLPKNIQ
jgi:Tol biopolymer transport system component